MKSFFLIVFALVFSMPIMAQDLEQFFKKTNTFLNTHVSNGKVDYKSIHSDASELDALLDMASSISVSSSDANKYQAFWINSYNLAVIKGIITHYPTKSPLNHSGFFDKTLYKIGGLSVTLNMIENKLLRAKFKDARIHFVLVCGAVGCPPLIAEAYMPETLEKQLDQQTKKAINGAFIKVNTKKKKLEVSEIMKWYKSDFTMNGKTEIDFINSYRTEAIPSSYKLSYFSYNWNLNKQ